MPKSFNNQNVRPILAFLKSWITPLVLVFILYYSGALAGISVVTQSALLKTGLMDYVPEEKPSSVAASFDYNLTVTDMGGNPVDFNQFKNKVIFLNLWATWCGPCRVEMPSIQNLYNDSDTSKIQFVMLSLDVPENRHKVSKYVADKQFTFPVYLLNGPLPSQLKVSSIPTTFVISKDGKIQTKKVGTANYDTDKFKKFLEGLNAE